MQIKPRFSMLMAVLAQMFMLLGVFWFFFALLGAGALLCKAAGAAAVAAAAGFAANCLVLRKQRPLLIMILVDAAVAVLSVWLIYRLCDFGGTALAAGLKPAWATVSAVILCLCILAALMLHIKWEAGRFRDGTLLTQIQILFLLGAVQVWAMDFSGSQPGMVMATFFMIAGLLAGMVGFKAAGLKEGRRGSSSGGPAIGALAVTGLAAGGAILLARPLGNGLAALAGSVKGVIGAILKSIVYAIGSLMGTNKAMTNEALSAGDNFGEGAAELIPQATYNVSFLRVLFLVSFGILAVTLVCIAIKMLIEFTIGKGISLSRKKGRYTANRQLPLRARIKAFFKELRQRIHARSVMRKHPFSVAAMVVWLEDYAGRKEELKRRPGETLRAFLSRLGEAKPEAAMTLAALADEADKACYSPESNLLCNFEQGAALKKLLTEK